VSLKPSQIDQSGYATNLLGREGVNPDWLTSLCTMDLDDDDSFFARNVLGGNPAPPQPNSVAAPVPQRPASPNPFQLDPDFDVWAADRDSDNTQGETPLQQLIRHWMNERHAPDILPVQQTLLSGLLDHIRRQVSSSCP